MEVRPVTSSPEHKGERPPLGSRREVWYCLSRESEDGRSLANRHDARATAGNNVPVPLKHISRLAPRNKSRDALLSRPRETRPAREASRVVTADLDTFEACAFGLRMTRRRHRSQIAHSSLSGGSAPSLWLSRSQIGGK